MPNHFYDYRRIPFEEDGRCQAFGDFLFYRDGSAALGNRRVNYGVPIHNYRFGANLLARRRIDIPNMLSIECPDGTAFIFEYSPHCRSWMRLVPLDDPLLVMQGERYGARNAMLLFELRRGGRYVWVKFVQLLVFVVVVTAIARLIEYAETFD